MPSVLSNDTCAPLGGIDCSQLEGEATTFRGHSRSSSSQPQLRSTHHTHMFTHLFTVHPGGFANLRCVF